MFSKETKALLHKSLPALPQLICGRSLKHDIDDLVAMALPVRVLAVVDDRQTEQAFGNQIFPALKGRFDSVHVTLESPEADMETVEELRQKTSRSDALIAAGSGTISDLCKYASFKDNKPYAVFPTAASMNGYLSANASISVNDYKKTFAAHMPKAVFCDLSVIAAAPPRLNKSGLGDSLARSTAQADWLLSHLLLGTTYDETPFDLLKPLEPHLHENARGIAGGDVQSLELLMQILLLSGLGMTIAGGSYPASQGEHMIAHTMEMVLGAPGPLSGKKIFHGEEIGVTTLFMAGLQETLLGTRPTLAPLDFPEEDMTKLFGSTVTEEAKKVYIIKRELIEKKLAVGLHWHDIAERIAPIMIPSAKIQAILKSAECPDTLQMLGWDGEACKTAINYARFLRDRFTFLDLA